jgi:hypothetical protein
MSALSLVLVVGLVLLGVAVSPRLAAWWTGDAARASLKAELDALENKKGMLRQIQDSGDEDTPSARRPPAA